MDRSYQLSQTSEQLEKNRQMLDQPAGLLANIRKELDQSRIFNNRTTEYLSDARHDQRRYSVHAEFR